MLVFGKNWTTRLDVVGQQACEICHFWTQACDRRQARLVSYIHYTNDYRQYGLVGNTAQHCRLALFPASDVAVKIRNRPRENLMFLSEVEHSSPSVGCARNKRPYPAVLQNRISFRWMFGCEWMDCLLLSCGMW